MGKKFNRVMMLSMINSMTVVLYRYVLVVPECASKIGRVCCLACYNQFLALGRGRSSRKLASLAY